MSLLDDELISIYAPWNSVWMVTRGMHNQMHITGSLPQQNGRFRSRTGTDADATNKICLLPIHPEAKYKPTITPDWEKVSLPRLKSLLLLIKGALMLSR